VDSERLLGDVDMRVLSKGRWGMTIHGETHVQILERENDELRGELAEVRGAMAADDERLRLAAERVGIVAGCDAPDEMADEVISLRGQLTEARAALVVLVECGEQKDIALRESCQQLGELRALLREACDSPKWRNGAMVFTSDWYKRAKEAGGLP